MRRQPVARWAARLSSPAVVVSMLLAGCGHREPAPAAADPAAALDASGSANAAEHDLNTAVRDASGSANAAEPDVSADGAIHHLQPSP
jgi:hypothetical protein